MSDDSIISLPRLGPVAPARIAAGFRRWTEPAGVVPELHVVHAIDVQIQVDNRVGTVHGRRVAPVTSVTLAGVERVPTQQ